jgi:pyruvate dehydrogenase E2 component (dihydrolipoamide acetyltransferase)
MADIVTMPKLGFDMAEGTLVRWVIAEGESIQKGSILAEIETDKATVEVESGYTGVVIRHLVAQGAIVPVNAPIAVIGEPGEEGNIDTIIGEVVEPGLVAEKEPAQTPSNVDPEVTPLSDTDDQLPDGLRASPLARRMARELGIELHKVKGSGTGNRITRKDIENYQASLSEIAPVAIIRPEDPVLATVYPASGLGAEPRYIPLTRLRSIIARRMVEATQQVPHFYVTHDYDVKSLVELRKQLNALLPEDEKFSVNDFIIKAVSLALLEFPNLNASIDLANDRLVQHPQVNVGVAVAVPNGLLTVVCREAERKTLRQIAGEVRGLVNRARDGKVRPEDIEGSTFTVSNLGMFDVEQFTAIINPPEAAILAIGSAREVPIIQGGEIQLGTRMKTTLSVDHRVSDGAEGARFLQALGGYLEAPLRLLV